MEFIFELKNTLLSWEEDILLQGLQTGEYNKEFCYDEYEIVIKDINKITTLEDILMYFMQDHSFRNSIQMTQDLMWDTKSLMN
jgi:hypothetical protein